MPSLATDIANLGARSVSLTPAWPASIRKAMHGRAARPGALLGDEDAQDEVLAKVAAADGLRRGAEGAAARRLTAPGPPLSSIFSTAGPLEMWGPTVAGADVAGYDRRPRTILLLIPSPTRRRRFKVAAGNGP